MTRILLVDDDTELASMLKEYLELEGYEVTAVNDGEAGVEEARSGRYALVVLDVMMPRLNGIEALRRIRMESVLPVLMLTAKGDDVDRVLGLELGADDYVPKPCTPRELAARIRAILRRTGNGHGEVMVSGTINAGPLSLWPEKRSATWSGSALDLTSTEFNLLEALAKRAGQVVSKAELSELGLGRPLARFDRSIDVHLSSIRHKLGQMTDGRSYIQTIRGQGYLFVKD